MGFDYHLADDFVSATDEYLVSIAFFFALILPLSSLDVIPPEYSTDLIFPLSIDIDRPYSSMLLQMGYETHNSLLNLGTIFYVQFLLIFLIVLVYAFEIYYAVK